MRGGVLVLGNLVFDILVRPVEALRWNATVWVEALEESLGGNGSNTAYTAGKLGVPVRLMACAGRDTAGEFALRKLAEAGVDTSLVRRTDAPTAATVAVVNAAGARALLHRPGASREAFAEPPDLGADATRGCAWFHLANAYALPQVRRNAAEILRRARQAGLETSIDTGWDSRGEWMQVLEPCLPHCDLLFVNEDEARRLGGTPDAEESARLFLRLGARNVVVKLGAAGCAAFGEAGEFHAPAFPVEVVDTTGAGDAFAGGFLAALARGLSFSEAARVANAAGALSVSRLGSVAGLRGWSETVAWVASFGRKALHHGDAAIVGPTVHCGQRGADMERMHTTATVKGQVLIPAALRRKYGIRKGTRIAISEEEGRIILEPITAEYIHRLRGCAEGTGAMEELMAERKWERERDC